MVLYYLVPLLNGYLPPFWVFVDENHACHIHVVAFLLNLLKLFFSLLILYDQGLEKVRTHVYAIFHVCYWSAIFAFDRLLLPLHDIFEDKFKRVGLTPFKLDLFIWLVGVLVLIGLRLRVEGYKVGFELAEKAHVFTINYKELITYFLNKFWSRLISHN